MPKFTCTACTLILYCSKLPISAQNPLFNAYEIESFQKGECWWTFENFKEKIENSSIQLLLETNLMCRKLFCVSHPNNIADPI